MEDDLLQGRNSRPNPKRTRPVSDRRRQRDENLSHHIQAPDAPARHRVGVDLLLGEVASELRWANISHDEVFGSRKSLRDATHLVGVPAMTWVWLAASVSGASVLLPYVVLQVGWIFPLIVLCVVGVCASVSSLVAQGVEFCRDTYGSHVCTWGEVVKVALGKQGKLVLAVLTVTQMFLSGAALTSLQIDQLFAAFSVSSPTIPDPSSSSITPFTVCVCVPLCTFVLVLLPPRAVARMHSLATLGVVAVMAAAFALPLSKHYPKHECHHFARVLKWQWIGVTVVVTVFLVGGLVNSAHFASRTMQSPRGFETSLTISGLLTTAILSFFALFSFYFFGSCTDHVVTVNIAHMGFMAGHLNVGKVVAGVSAATLPPLCALYTRQAAALIASLFESVRPSRLLLAVSALVVVAGQVVVARAVGGSLRCGVLAGVAVVLSTLVFPVVVFLKLRWEAIGLGLHLWCVVVLVVLVAVAAQAVVQAFVE